MKTTVVFVSFAPDRVKANLSFNRFLPANSAVDTSFSLQGSLTLSFSIDRPVLANLILDTLHNFSVYLLPNDTQRVIIDRAIAGYNLVYQGSARNINTYYSDKKKAKGYFYASERTYLLPTELTVQRGFAVIDSFKRQELAFLKSYKSILPPWFYRKESELLYLCSLTAKLTLNGKKYLPFKDLVQQDPVFKIPIVHPADSLNQREFAYFMYLNLYYFKRYADQEKEPYVIRYRKAVEGMKADHVPASIRELYNTYLLSFMIPYAGNLDVLGQNQQLWNDLKPEFNDRGHIQLLDSLIAKRSRVLQVGKSLKPNMAAPVIVFEDTKGLPVSIADFKGKWIYLDFWATWCVPCRHDLELKKDLGFDKISDQLVILNVCAKSERGVWLNYLSKHRPVGINWYADQEQSKKMDSLYQVLGLAHYVLIKPDGTIYQNAAAHPNEMANTLKIILNH